MGDTTTVPDSSSTTSVVFYYCDVFSDFFGKRFIPRESRDHRTLSSCFNVSIWTLRFVLHHHGFPMLVFFFTSIKKPRSSVRSSRCSQWMLDTLSVLCPVFWMRERTGSVILSCLYVLCSFYCERTWFVLFVFWDTVPREHFSVMFYLYVLFVFILFVFILHLL